MMVTTLILFIHRNVLGLCLEEKNTAFRFGHFPIQFPDCVNFADHCSALTFRTDMFSGSTRQLWPYQKRWFSVAVSRIWHVHKSKLRIGWRPTLSARTQNSESIGGRHSQAGLKTQNRLAADTLSPNSKLRIGWRPTLSARFQNSESVGGRHSQPGCKTQNRLAADIPSLCPRSRVLSHDSYFLDSG